jgi:hypothetical protein
MHEDGHEKFDGAGGDLGRFYSDLRIFLLIVSFSFGKLKYSNIILQGRSRSYAIPFQIRVN